MQIFSSNLVSERRPLFERRGLSRVYASLFVVSSMFTLPTFAQDLTMRSGVSKPSGEVRGVTFAGVEVVAPDGAVRVISWDQVASVEGPHAKDAAELSEVATLAWRARVRMERGDVSGAEQLFEQLFVKYRGQSGATAGVVASGLLRCRLSRQAQNAAVEAWLALLATGESETLFDREKPDEDLRVVPIVDAATGLAPQLPPIWIKGPALQVVLSAIAPSSGAAPMDRAGKLAMLYRISAVDEVQRSGGAVVEQQVLPARSIGEPGLELVWDVVASRCGDDAQQTQAMTALEARINSSDTPAWVQAWSRFALGRAMMAQGKATGNKDQRGLGMIHLLHVPSRFASISPYLAGLALAEVAGALADDGDVEGASRVRRVFLEQYPAHPAQAILPVVKTVPKPATTSTTTPAAPANATKGGGS